MTLYYVASIGLEVEFCQINFKHVLFILSFQASHMQFFYNFVNIWR